MMDQETRERHNEYTDIMVDIETLATSNDAAIVSIGAVAFNADGENGPLWGNSPDELADSGQGFRVNVDLANSNKELRGEIAPETVEWWLGQSDEARAMLVDGERQPLGCALQMFADWIKRIAGRPKAMRLWSNGPTFDETIIRAAYTRYGMALPMSFRGSRCCRTMIEVAELLGWRRREAAAFAPNDIVKHDALGDAVFQARSVASQRAFLASQMVFLNNITGPGEVT